MCIFHDENYLKDPENKEAHEQNIKNKLTNKIEKSELLICIGYCLPGFSFKSQRFDRPVNFRSAVFSGPADFSGAQFTKEANFSYAQFRKEILRSSILDVDEAVTSVDLPGDASNYLNL